MKKHLRYMFTALIIGSVFFASATSSVLAWDDCTKGMVDDPYPGSCAKYIDTDGNGICDHSEPAPEDRVEVKQSDEVNVGNSQQNNSINVKDQQTDNTQKILLISAGVFVTLVVTAGYSYIKKR